MKKIIKWNGEYRDVFFEINNFEVCEKQYWTFYLYLYIEQFPESIRKKIAPATYYTNFGTKLESYYDNPLNGLAWHCGMTYCKVEGKEPFTMLKVGCDYQHLWDEGQCYDEQELERDAKKCIDSLYVQFPEIKKAKDLMEEFRSKFKHVNNSDHRMFNINADPI